MAVTQDDLTLLRHFATGPTDAYEIHYARIALARLLEDYEVLLAELKTLKEQAVSKTLEPQQVRPTGGV